MSVNHSNYENVVVRFVSCFLCYVFGLIFFINGLIPSAVVDTHLVSGKDLFNECHPLINEDLCRYQKNIDQNFNHCQKVAVIVIDALRADFLPSVIKNTKFTTSMNFTEKLLSTDNAISFITRNFAPTVTMPRIKTLVTGTVSNFLDIIINFNAAELADDNILKQASLAGFKSIFYGDDTWLKLFPNIFERSEGTHSFFVSDFKEVDLNVSRHIERELKENDWTIMILHFLGVDHIGHTYGPLSKHLPSKLIEMDEVIKLIYQNMKNNSKIPSLIIVCGDHGMTASGSHGGITQDELLTPLIFISTAKTISVPFETDVIDQVDFAPTLSVILGVPIPVKNIGNIIPSVLEFIGFSPEEVLYAAYYNCLQLLNVYSKTFVIETKIADLIIETTKKHFILLNNKNSSLNNNEYMHIKGSYQIILRHMKQDLLNTVHGYNEFSMMLGIFIMWLFFFFSFCLLILVRNNMNNILNICLQNTITSKFNLLSPALIIICMFCKIKTEILLIPFLIFVFVFICYLIKNLYTSIYEIFCMEFVKKLFFVFLFAHALSLFSSSFIEEEHQTWYFLTCTVILFLSCRKFYFSLSKKLKNFRIISTLDILKWMWNANYLTIYATFSVLILHRISRKWNQVGNKWQHISDISDWLNEKRNAPFLLVCILISQFLLIIYFKKKLDLNYILFCIGIICISLQKLDNCLLLGIFQDFTKSFIIPWIVYLLIISIIISTFFQIYSCTSHSKKERIQTVLISFIAVWILLTEIIGRAHNIPIIVIVLIQEYFLSKLLWKYDCDNIISTICYLIMAMASFSYYGNSNAFSSIDVVTGYTGMKSYVPYIIGFLIVCNTYSTVVLWLIMIVYRIICSPSTEDFDCTAKKLKLTFLFLLDYKLFILVLYSTIMYIMRYHLFIFSVFLPKLFYEICNTLLFTLTSWVICLIINRA